MNQHKAGSAIPVKFSLAGNQGLTIFASGYPASEPVDCVSLGSQGNQVPTASAGPLVYAPRLDQYTYNWKTDKSWEGTCRQLSMELVDGSVHTAYIKFTC